jgi:Mn-dependent DtxR family transcriptional regulator
MLSKVIEQIKRLKRNGWVNKEKQRGGDERTGDAGVIDVLVEVVGF